MCTLRIHVVPIALVELPGLDTVRTLRHELDMPLQHSSSLRLFTAPESRKGVTDLGR